MKTEVAAAGPLMPILCILGAYFIFAGGDAAAKYLILEGMHPVFLLWARSVGQCIVVAILLRLPVNPRRFCVVNLRLQLLRGAAIVLAGILAYASLDTLPLVDMITIIFGAPLMVTALAGLMLGERVDLRRWIAVVVGFSGVLVVTRPGMGGFGIGHFYAVLVMLLTCVFIILTRKLSATETGESLLMMPAIVGAIFLFPAVPFVGTVQLNLLQWVLVVSLGIAASMAYWLVVRAYRAAEASMLAPYIYLQVLWSLMLGYLVFGQLPDRWTVTGAIIIISSGIYLLHRDRQRHAASKSR